MSVARSVADVLRDHVLLELEAIDRMYLNVYVPHLQTVRAVVGYLHVHRGQRFASTTAVVPMSEAFVRNIEQFVADERIDLVSFAKRERKDDVTQKYLRRFRRNEGVLYVGKAQEKARLYIRENLIQIAPIFVKQKYMLGEEFSMLDVAIAPLLWRLDHYQVQLNKQSAPLLKYAERLFSRQAFIDSMTASEKAMRR